MLMDQFMKLMAMDYLLLILRQPIQAITSSLESCEVRKTRSINVWVCGSWYECIGLRLCSVQWNQDEDDF